MLRTFAAIYLSGIIVDDVWFIEDYFVVCLQIPYKQFQLPKNQEKSCLRKIHNLPETHLSCRLKFS